MARSTRKTGASNVAEFHIHNPRQRKTHPSERFSTKITASFSKKSELKRVQQHRNHPTFPSSSKQPKLTVRVGDSTFYDRNDRPRNETLPRKWTWTLCLIHVSGNELMKPSTVTTRPAAGGCLETVGHAHVLVVALDHEWCRAAVQGLVLEAADADGVLAGGGVRGDLDVVVAHRVLAADALLVADGGNEGAAVAGAVGHVEVDVEPVHLGPDAVEVVELRTSDIGGNRLKSRQGRKRGTVIGSGRSSVLFEVNICFTLYDPRVT